MRTTDPVIPPAAASEETATTQTALAFEDNKLASILFGQYGQNLALIERRLGVVAEQRACGAEAGTRERQVVRAAT